MTKMLLIIVIGTILVVLAFRYWVLSFHRPPKIGKELTEALELSELDITKFPYDYNRDELLDIALSSNDPADLIRLHEGELT